MNVYRGTRNIQKYQVDRIRNETPQSHNNQNINCIEQRIFKLKERKITSYTKAN